MADLQALHEWNQQERRMNEKRDAMLAETLGFAPEKPKPKIDPDWKRDAAIIKKHMGERELEYLRHGTSERKIFIDIQPNFNGA